MNKTEKNKNSVDSLYGPTPKFNNFYFFIFLSLQPHRILQALRRYVRAENKDRQHTIRHYQHVLAVDPEKAAQMKSQVGCITETYLFIYHLRLTVVSRSPFELLIEKMPFTTVSVTFILKKIAYLIPSYLKKKKNRQNKTETKTY